MCGKQSADNLQRYQKIINFKHLSNHHSLQEKADTVWPQEYNSKLFVYVCDFQLIKF